MEIKNLCKAYGDLPVLENVSFTAGVGVTALWGPSGVGKTTLLRDLIRQIGEKQCVSVVDERGELFPEGLEPVSYTHLTLPTICSV